MVVVGDLLAVPRQHLGHVVADVRTRSTELALHRVRRSLALEGEGLRVGDGLLEDSAHVPDGIRLHRHALEPGHGLVRQPREVEVAHGQLHEPVDQIECLVTGHPPLATHQAVDHVLPLGLERLADELGVLLEEAGDVIDDALDLGRLHLGADLRPDHSLELLAVDLPLVDPLRHVGQRLPVLPHQPAVDHPFADLHLVHLERVPFFRLQEFVHLGVGAVKDVPDQPLQPDGFADSLVLVLALQQALVRLLGGSHPHLGVPDGGRVGDARLAQFGEVLPGDADVTLCRLEGTGDGHAAHLGDARQAVHDLVQRDERTHPDALVVGAQRLGLHEVVLAADNRLAEDVLREERHLVHEGSHASGVGPLLPCLEGLLRPHHLGIQPVDVLLGQHAVAPRVGPVAQLSRHPACEQMLLVERLRVGVHHQRHAQDRVLPDVLQHGGDLCVRSQLRLGDHATLRSIVVGVIRLGRQATLHRH